MTAAATAYKTPSSGGSTASSTSPASPERFEASSRRVDLRGSSDAEVGADFGADVGVAYLDECDWPGVIWPSLQEMTLLVARP